MSQLEVILLLAVLERSDNTVTMFTIKYFHINYVSDFHSTHVVVFWKMVALTRPKPVIIRKNQFQL